MERLFASMTAPRAGWSRRQNDSPGPGERTRRAPTEPASLHVDHLLVQAAASLALASVERLELEQRRIGLFDPRDLRGQARSWQPEGPHRA